VVEWISFFLNEVRSPEYGYFKTTDDHSLLVPVHAAENLNDFRGIGRIMGLALTMRITGGIRLASGPLFWLKYGNIPGSLENRSSETLREWCREISPTILHSLESLRDPQVRSSGGIQHYFPDDEQVLTEENVDEFVHQWLLFRVLKTHKDPMIMILKGISDIVSLGYFNWFSIDEIRILLGGSSEIVNVEHLRAATEVSHTPGYDMAQEKEWFWEILREFDQEQMSSFLHYVSGSTTPPLDGFRGTQGADKWMTLSFEGTMRNDSYPRAQTCFRTLRLSRYTSKETMKMRILIALVDGQTLEHV
jgi:hypothetical protein